MSIQIVLIEPQIPQNTGSIARTCAATQSPLHIVGKPAFEISDRTVKRAGLDYWPFVNLSTHENFDSYCKSANPGRIWLFSKYGKIPYYQPEFKDNDSLVFGSETKGLGDDFMKGFDPAQILLIPMLCDGVRSLNLSNAVSIALYEALKQTRSI